MIDEIRRLYVFIFARRKFARFNRFIFSLSLGGLGILNHRSPSSSGEISFLKDYLPNKRGVLIDIGANEGEYSRNATRINDRLRIYAFEPHPKTFDKLCGCVGDYQNITVLNSGLSDSPGILELYDYMDDDGSQHASLFKDVITDIHGCKSFISHKVELTTIDRFVSLNSISEISLLKIDTEGNELRVLQGAKRTLAEGRIKAIHFEFNEMNVISRTFFKDFERILIGYRLFRLLPSDMLEIVDYTPLHFEIFAYQNIVAIREE